jgi:hypothetical protein
MLGTSAAQTGSAVLGVFGDVARERHRLTNPFIYESDGVLLDGLPGEAADVPSGPPFVILGAAIVQIMLQLLFFVLPTAIWNWAGYGLGAVVVPTTVFFFRRIDRSRRRQPTYIRPDGVTWLPTALLLAGVMLALLHAYHIASHRTLA